MGKLLAIIIAIMLGLGLAAAVGALSAVFVMLCWDYVAPALFGLPEITFWQALALSILCSLLFRSGVSTSSN